MPILHERIETALPIDQAFAFVGDFANSERWDPGVATSERIDPGAVAVGARYRLGVRVRGRVSRMEYRVTTYEPPRRVVLEGEGAGVTAVDDIRFEPAGGGTVIDYTADIRMRGLLRVAEPLLGGTFAGIARNAAAGMRRALAELAAKQVANPGPAMPGGAG